MATAQEHFQSTSTCAYMSHCRTMTTQSNHSDFVSIRQLLLNEKTTFKMCFKQNGIRKKRHMHFKELLHCAENQMFLAVI